MPGMGREVEEIRCRCDGASTHNVKISVSADVRYVNRRCWEQIAPAHRLKSAWVGMHEWFWYGERREERCNIPLIENSSSYSSSTPALWLASIIIRVLQLWAHLQWWPVRGVGLAVEREAGRLCISIRQFVSSQ